MLHDQHGGHTPFAFVPRRILRAYDISHRAKFVYAVLDAIRARQHADGMMADALLLDGFERWIDPDCPDAFALAVGVRTGDIARALGIRDVRRDIEQLAKGGYASPIEHDDGSLAFFMPLQRRRTVFQREAEHVHG